MVNIRKIVNAKFYGNFKNNSNGLGFKNLKTFLNWLSTQGISGRGRTEEELKEEIMDKYLDSNIALSLPNTPNYLLKDIPKYEKTDSRKTKVMTASTFRLKDDSDSPIDINSFYNSIVFYNKHLFNNKGERVVIRFSNEDDVLYEGDAEIAFRSIRLGSQADFISDINTLLSKKNLAGSDTFSAVLSPTLDWFKLYFLTKEKNLGGGSYSINCKEYKNKYFKIKKLDFVDNNNCLFNCIKNSVDKYKNMDCKKIRGLIRRIKLKDDSLIKIRQIPEIERCLRVNINVYTGLTRTDKFYTSKQKYNKTVNVILFEEHYYLINGSKKIAEKKKPTKNKLETKYLIYDLETIFDRNSCDFLKVSCLAWYIMDDLYNFKYDIKTLEDCRFERENPLKKLLDVITSPPKGYKYKIIGFNNSRFDNFLLADYALKNEKLGKVFFVNNSILDMKIGNSDTFDLCRFIPSSLKNACNSFNTEPKKVDGFSHKEPQDAFEIGGKEGLDKWITDNYEKLEHYNKIDVLCLASLISKCASSVLELTTKNITDYQTIGQLSYKYWDEIRKLNNIETPKPNNIVDDVFIRKSLVAGRTQAYFHKMIYSGLVKMVDVKSLYPFVMMNYKFPIGSYIETSKYHRNKLGIYRCKIIHQNMKWNDRIHKYFNTIDGSKFKTEFAPVVVPLRTKDNPLDWDYRGEQIINLTTIDIECIKKYGGEIEIYEGIYWENTSEDVFNCFLEPFMNCKNNQDTLKKSKDEKYNPALRELCKLFSNSLSGKVIQRNFEEETVFAKNSTDIRDFHNKTKEGGREYDFGNSFVLCKGKKIDDKIFGKNAKPSYLGVFIYAYARRYMYETILNKYCVFYEDTDSALLPQSEFEDFIIDNKEIYNTGVYGCLEEEVGDANKAVIIAKKCYCVINEKDSSKSKYKSKGVSKNHKYMTEKEIMKKYGVVPEKLTKKQIEDIFNEINTFCLTEQFFMDQYNNEVIIVFQSSLKRVCQPNNDLNDINFGIKQVFNIKRLNPTE